MNIQHNKNAIFLKHDNKETKISVKLRDEMKKEGLIERCEMKSNGVGYNVYYEFIK